MAKLKITEVTSFLEMKLKDLNLEAWNNIKQLVDLREGTKKLGDDT